MRRETRANVAVRPPRTFVLDCEALSKAVLGDHEMATMVQSAPIMNISVATSSLTTLEAWNPRQGARQGLWNWTLSRITVVHTDDQVIMLAREMLRSAGLHGHKYAIDAVLAAVAAKAAQRGEQVTIFTSDMDDMGKLLADFPMHVELEKL